MTLIKNFFKSDIRQKNFMFWDWIFPVILMAAASIFIRGNEDSTVILGGLMAFLILQSSIYSLPYRIAQFRQKGILEIVAEEGNIMKFTLSFLATRIIVILVQVAVFLLLGLSLTNSKADINFPYFILTVISGILALGGFSAFLGTISKTEQSALGFAQLFYLLFSAISGIFFPLDKSPQFLKIISFFSPVTYLNKSLGYSLTSKTTDLYGITFLLVFGLFFLFLSALLYRKILNCNCIRYSNSTSFANHDF